MNKRLYALHFFILKEETFVNRNFRVFAVFDCSHENLSLQSFSKLVIGDSLCPQSFSKLDIQEIQCPQNFSKFIICKILCSQSLEISHLQKSLSVK